MRKIFCLFLAVLFLSAGSGFAGGDDPDVRELLKEVKALRKQLAEMDQIKKRLAVVEAQLAKTSDAQKDSDDKKDKSKIVNPLAEIKSSIKEKGVDIGGTLEFQYVRTDSTEDSLKKVGDMGFNDFRLDVDAEINELIFSGQYRWYSYMHTIHHGWIGYNFSDSVQVQLGVTQVPFGILPYASHNWWEGITYYLGFEDNFDIGLKVLYRQDDWDLQLAFFKNAELGNPSRTNKYSYDMVTSGTQLNEEINTLNGRLSYMIHHNGNNKTEIGISGMAGQVYNSGTEKNGYRWAGAAHLDGYYGPFNLMLEGVRYEFLPKNPQGVDDSTVQFGAFNDTYLVASKGTIVVANLSYDIPVNWGPVTKLSFYNDYSVLFKDENSFEQSHLNTAGCLITADPVIVYVDFIMGTNAIGVNDTTTAFAAGDSDYEWNDQIRINVEYSF